MKRLLLLLVTCIACAAAQQPSKPARPTTAATYQVSGKVIHAITGEPLAATVVTLSPSIDPQRRGPVNLVEESRSEEIHPVVSGSDGSFAFPNVKPGKYMLSAMRRGFSQQAYLQHEQYSTAIIVGRDKESSNIVFRLQPDASISGRVVDEHNEAVANAQVTLFREGLQNGKRGIYRAQQTQTSDEGLYRFAHIRPGKFYVVVSAMPWYSQYNGGGRGRMIFRGGGAPAPEPDEGNEILDTAFPVTFYPGVTDSARAEAIELKPGQRENADFTLVAVPSLHVRVITPSGDGQQNVSAALMQEIFDSPDAGMRGRSMTVNNGVTEISGLTPGHYVLQVNSYSPNRGPQPGVRREVDIASSMDLNATDVPTGVNVTGTVRFDGPSPQGPIRIALRRASFQMFPLQVNAKGEISNDRPVMPDSYDVVLPVSGYQISNITVSGAKLTGQTIQVGGDDVHMNIVASKSSGRVEGVALKDGQPLAGAMVVLVPEDADRQMLYRRDQSDSDGSFDLSSVTPGKYTLIALENGWELEWGKPEVLKPFLAAGEPVRVAIDGKYQVNAKVQ
jgi:hypothetical protein